MGLEKDLKFIVADASTFSLPNKNCLIFIHNPFNELIMRNFLNHNIQHFNKFDSVIALSGNPYKELFRQLDFEVIMKNIVYETTLLALKK